MLRADRAVQADREVAGLGVGNRTVDWAIGPADNRRVLLDVKRRLADFILQMSADGNTPPEHDVGLLFRSVEGKFLPADPGSTLQGVWVMTDIKQDEAKLRAAFDTWIRQRFILRSLGTPSTMFTCLQGGQRIETSCSVRLG